MLRVQKSNFCQSHFFLWATETLGSRRVREVRIFSRLHPFQLRPNQDLTVFLELTDEANRGNLANGVITANSSRQVRWLLPCFCVTE